LIRRASRLARRTATGADKRRPLCTGEQRSRPSGGNVASNNNNVNVHNGRKRNRIAGIEVAVLVSYGYKKVNFEIKLKQETEKTDDSLHQAPAM